LVRDLDFTRTSRTKQLAPWHFIVSAKFEAAIIAWPGCSFAEEFAKAIIRSADYGNERKRPFREGRLKTLDS
jgi:hypothetical protein